MVQGAASVEAIFFILPLPSEFCGPGRAPLGLFRVRKSTELPHFKRFLTHLSAPCPDVRRVCLPSSLGYPAGAGSAAIRRTIAPKSRRVR